jgi:hypothetical protein
MPDATASTWGPSGRKCLPDLPLTKPLFGEPKGGFFYVLLERGLYFAIPILTLARRL